LACPLGDRAAALDVLRRILSVVLDVERVSMREK
jgi:hypothetical protein